MDSERELRTEFRQALDDVLPPAPWLETAVKQNLQNRRLSPSVHRVPSKSRPRRTVFPQIGLQLAAGALAVLLAVAALAAYVGLHYRGPQSEPADAVAIADYQAMMNRHDNQLADMPWDSCSTTQDASCPAATVPLRNVLQQWIDDMNRSQPPPTRFATIDVLMRRHLNADVSNVDAELAAYQARDDVSLYLASNAARKERHWLDTVAIGVIFSRQGTVAAYSNLLVAKQNLADCTYCHTLRGQSVVSCTGDQRPSCQAEIVEASLWFGQFEADIVRVAAPSALATKDARLQQDVDQADSALVVMDGAALGGDQTSFDAGRLSMQTAMTVVDADIADILNG